MSKKLKAALITAVVALIAGFAVSNGLISQQTADEIEAKTEEVLNNEEATQPAPSTEPAPQAPGQSSAEPQQGQ